jgi:sortase (surface protein transpeptidase)
MHRVGIVRWIAASRLTPVLLAVAGCVALVVALVLASSVAEHAGDPPAAGGATSRVSMPGADPRPPRTTRPTPPARSESTADRLRGDVLPDAEPVLLRIPRLQVTSPLVPLGLDATGAMEVPADGRQAGWYTKAPSPGALGPAVIAGHVTWNGDPGIFLRLGSLRRADRLEVLREDGRTAVFAVRRVETFAKAEFPTASVYGATDHAALRLITCGGRFDAGRRRYDNNVVVFAAMVGVR